MSDHRADAEKLIRAVKEDKALLDAVDVHLSGDPDAWNMFSNAIGAGITVPLTYDALDVVKEVLWNCQEVRAQYTAEQDKGPFHISVLGFGEVCIV